jgi:acetylornithine deacetylase/succinyl-diaminopimelate desuccinylase-like protein
MEKCDHSGFQQNLVQFASELIQIDTSNWGDGAETVGEAAAADYCASVLRQYGWDPEVFTTTSDARRGVALRVSGSDPSIPALIFHAHLDTVPAIASEWSRPPFEGAVDEGCVWGRGAVDMKGMVAVILGVLQIWGIQRKRPRRDIIILLLPDEEAGGRHGAEWLTEHRKDLIEGASEAIGEVGGFSVHVTNEIRVYPVQVAEKGVHWVQLRAYGNGGHGSLDHPDNPVARISSAIARLTAFDWPPGSSGVTDELLNRLGRLLKSDRSNGMPESEVLSPVRPPDVS